MNIDKRLARLEQRLGGSVEWGDPIIFAVAVDGQLDSDPSRLCGGFAVIPGGTGRPGLTVPWASGESQEEWEARVELSRDLGRVVEHGEYHE